jgi:hypothetical protein
VFPNAADVFRSVIQSLFLMQFVQFLEENLDSLSPARGGQPTLYLECLKIAYSETQVTPGHLQQKSLDQV